MSNAQQHIPDAERHNIFRFISAASGETKMSAKLQALALTPEMQSAFNQVLADHHNSGMDEILNPPREPMPHTIIVEFEPAMMCWDYCYRAQDGTLHEVKIDKDGYASFVGAGPL